MDQPMPSTDEIVRLEKAYWDALKAKDGRRAAALSGRTNMITGPLGVRNIGQDLMRQMTEDGDWEIQSYAFDQIEVSIPSPDVAIIAYTVRQKARIGSEVKETRAADLSLWIRDADGWKCHAHS